MTATDHPPGDLAVVELMLADPTLTVEEARAACGLPYFAEPLPAPGRVVLVRCPVRAAGFRVVPAGEDM